MPFFCPACLSSAPRAFLLPIRRENEQLCKRQAFKDATKCISLSASVLPSICFYTVLHTHSGWVPCLAPSCDSHVTFNVPLFFFLPVLMLYPSLTTQLYWPGRSKTLQFDCGR